MVACANHNKFGCVKIQILSRTSRQFPRPLQPLLQLTRILPDTVTCLHNSIVQLTRSVAFITYASSLGSWKNLLPQVDPKLIGSIKLANPTLNICILDRLEGGIKILSKKLASHNPLNPDIGFATQSSYWLTTG